MDRYRKLVVGLDVDLERKEPTPGSRQAAREAGDLAARTGASLSFVHSVHAETCDESPDGVESTARAALEGLVKGFAVGGSAPELCITDQPAWLEMIRRVHDGRADLVVVGKRSIDDGDGRTFGTVATRLLRKCPAPVWCVHPERHTTDGCVLAATDLTEVGQRATGLGQYVAGSFELDFHILHVYQVPLSIQLAPGHGDSEEAIHEHELELRDRILDALPSDTPEPHVHVLCNSPARGIAAALDHLKPGLLVMGTLSRTGIAGMLTGNSAERLLPRIDCSLLAIKPEGFVSPIS